MKTRTTLLNTAVAAILLATSVSHALAAEPSENKLNRGYLSSPRAREEFPELARGGNERVRSEKVSTPTVNRALANSPRYREEHPAGALRALMSPSAIPPELIKNRAFAASPRVREEFPALQRNPAPFKGREKFEVAPLK